MGKRVSRKTTQIHQGPVKIITSKVMMMYQSGKNTRIPSPDLHR